ncbi:MAG: histidine kinase [Hungatella sp.]
MLMCWFLPFCLLIGVVGYYLLSYQYGLAAERVVDQVEYNSQICVERLNYGMTASRKATYDKTLETAWQLYRKADGGYHHLYNDWKGYLSREYGQAPCFSDTIVWGYENPKQITCNVYNSSAGGSYQNIQTYWKEDHEAVKAYLEQRDTAVGYISLDGRLYMVRNLIDSSYDCFGALIMRLNPSYCFGPLIDAPLGTDCTICLDDQIISLKGKLMTKASMGIPTEDENSGYKMHKGNLYVFDFQKENYFKLSTLVKIKSDVMALPFYGYPYIFGGMLLFLLPLLLVLLKVFKQNVTKPIETLMRGAEQVEDGNLGFQLTASPENLEFQYLIESFNRMSERLKYQFDHIYEEELALRDAKIIALQSHINPHFMNNTLEIINWEARMEGNVKVSKMIESLSILMDAAIDRKRRATVPLSEEMVYVNAYLYINSERFGKRLTVIQELDETIMDYMVPRLILQPVIENAIAHGVQTSGYGTVILRGHAEAAYLYLEILNDGTLSSEDEARIARFLAPDYDSSKEPSGNVGIANVNQRLRILYGEPCGLTIEKDGDSHVIARLVIAIP